MDYKLHKFEISSIVKEKTESRYFSHFFIYEFEILDDYQL